MLSSPSRCSGVSRSQEVIEFPLLKISMGALAGNPPEEDCRCVCVSVCHGGSKIREEMQRAAQNVKGAITKDKNCSYSKMFKER